MKVYEEEVNLLITNKGENLRVVSDKNSQPINNYLKEKLLKYVPLLYSNKYIKQAPWWIDRFVKEYPITIESDDVSLHGDGSIDTQLKHAVKFKITIEKV